MSEESEHVILAGLLQKPLRMADAEQLRTEFFSDEATAGLFIYARAFYRKRERKNALDIPLARAKLEVSKSPRAPALLELVEEYDGYDPITDAEFQEGLRELVDRHVKSEIQKHGSDAVKAILKGDFDRAKELMQKGVMAAEDGETGDDTPTDIRSTEEIQIERELVQREKEEDDERAGFDIGFPRITKCVSLRRQELVIVGGYSADGKTQFTKCLAYNAAMNSGANVLFVALEMSKREMRVLFVAQHAASIDPRGVDYRSILDGTASDQDKRLYLKALEDFEWTKEDDGEQGKTARGSIHVWSPRKRIKMRQFIARVRAMKKECGLDVAVGDYLELIQPDRDLGQYRLNVKEMVEQGKSLSREQDMLLFLNHQISRKGRDEAEKRKPNHYLMRDLGESSGVERSADNIFWIYSDDDLKDDREAIVGIAKARKGRTMVRGVHVYANFERSLVAPLASEDWE